MSDTDGPTDGPYTFRGVYGDEVVEIEMTAEQMFDALHRRKPISTIGDGDPIVDEDGQLGERHVTSAEQARRAQEDDTTDA
jgi:hypothetical protein